MLFRDPWLLPFRIRMTYISALTRCNIKYIRMQERSYNYTGKRKPFAIAIAASNTILVSRVTRHYWSILLQLARETLALD